MEFVLKKYKLVLIIAGILLLALAVWLFLLRDGLDKIPTRGVFVMLKK